MSFQYKWYVDKARPLFPDMCKYLLLIQDVCLQTLKVYYFKPRPHIYRYFEDIKDSKLFENLPSRFRHFKNSIFTALVWMGMSVHCVSFMNVLGVGLSWWMTRLYFGFCFDI